MPNGRSCEFCGKSHHKYQQFSEKELKMKRVQTSLFFVAVVGLWGMCGVVTAFSGAGSGTESSPYIITTVEQLQEMNDDCTACYELDCDIDASATQTWNGGAGFEPVGNPTDLFTGIFDGRGHTITGLYINKPLANGVGLFGYLHNGAEVKNVGLIDAESYGNYYVGTLAGTSYSGCLIHNCYATGEVTISADGSRDAKSGGLVGSQAWSTISKCYSAVNVTALSSRYQIGGLCGYSAARSGYPPALIENCYSTGTVTSNGWKVGGLLGDADGENSTVSKCYSVGRVNGSRKRGLVGYNFRSPIIRDSYWDVQTSGCSSSRGGTGKQTAQMMQQATFVNWDFDEIWDIVENQGYPFFRIEYGDLIGLEIVGPNEAAENFGTSYNAIAYYDNNMTRDVTDSALWAVEPNTAANIDENGVLTTQDVVKHRSATILASYTEEDVTFDAGKVVNIFPTCPGTALQFDGNDGVYLLGSAGTGSTLNIYDSDIAISAWVKIGEGGTIVARAKPHYITYRLLVRPHTAGLNVYAPGHHFVLSNEGLSQDTWYHIVGVFDRHSDKGYVYINGTLAASGPLPDAPPGNDGLTKIGCRNNVNDIPFNGTIDEVAIYNKALSAEEIQANIHTRLAGDEPNLVGYWDLDEGEGQIVYDLSGNGNDGYLGEDPCGVDAGDPAWLYSDAPLGLCSLNQMAAVATKNAAERKTAMLEEVQGALTYERTAYEALDEWFESGDYVDFNKGDIVTGKQKIHSAMQHEGQQSIGALDKSVEKLKDALNALGHELLVSNQSVLAPGGLEWREPVAVTEVNTESAEEMMPFLSFDGLTLYFAKVRTQTFYYGRIFEATRPEPFGPFTSVSEVSGTLNSSSGHVLSPWVSPDNLRMYYYTEVSAGWELKVTERASENDPWPIGTNISELNALGNHHQTPRLTADELTIFFSSHNMPGGQGSYDIWTATRPDRNSPFGEVRNLAEINTASFDHAPFVSPDGLTLYFDSNRNGQYQLFRATRRSLNKPFGNVEHLSLLDAPEGTNAHPCISSDGTAIYFTRDVEGENSIMVSYLIEPYELAIIRTEDAIAKKVEVLERISAELEKEWAAYEVLEELLESGDYGDLDKGDIVTAKQKIHSAIQHQEQTIDALEKSIAKLKDALSALGYDPAGQASNPNPANGATSVDIFADLDWTAGPKTVSHDVYFGTTNPPAFIGNQTATTFDPGIMAGTTTYYWRIDEVNPSWTTTGTVWSFTTSFRPPI
jgi:hypothetical protein